MRVSLLAMVGIVLAAWLGPATAAADTEETYARAKAAFQRAEVEFGAGQFEEALKYYLQAYRLKPLPELHFNLGQTYRNLGRYEKAIFHYKQFLARVADTRLHADAEALIERCESKLAQARRSEEEASSEKEAEPPSEAMPPASRPREETEVPRALAPAAQRQEEAGRAARGAPLHQAWFWSGVGLTSAMVVSGIVTGVLALDRSSSYKDPETAPDTLPSLRDEGEALRTMANVSFGLAAGAAVATAVAYFYTDFGGSAEGGPDEGGPSARAAVIPTATGASLSVAGRF